MVSLRKRYVNRIEASPHQDAPPVSAPPEITAAELPPIAADAKPPEPVVETGPAEAAASSFIKDRLSEMERAEALHREQQQPPQPRAAEPTPLDAEEIIAGSNIPDLAKNWLRQHLEYVMDPVKNNTIIALHDVAKRQAGSEFTDDYFERMEDLLGIAPATNGQAQRPTPQQQMPPRQPMRPMAVSAPPSREVPSMSTGRAPSRRAPLTRDELEIAAASGMTAEQYQAQKERMLRMKAAGEMQ